MSDINEDILKRLYLYHVDYINNLEKEKKDNKIKIRLPNFPEHLSENIIKFILLNKLNIKCDNNKKKEI